MKKLYLTSFIIALFILSGAESPAAAPSTREYPTGLKILIFYDNAEGYATDYDGITANYTAAGNTVTVVTQSNWNFTTNSTDLTGYDVLMVSVWGGVSGTSGALNGSDGTTTSQVDSIVSWFDSGDKLLWVGSDSDFGGNWVANQTNPLLEALGTGLRIDAGAIADSQSKDAASYRVSANETGVSSTFVDAVTAGFDEMIFHGPTSVMWWDGSQYTDLRNRTETGIEIIVNSSRAAEGLDQDTSVGLDDYYAYVDTNASSWNRINGSYPMLTADWNAGTATTSLLVVGGERNFADYKNMYGNTMEKRREHHSGDTVVDAILHYYFTDAASPISVKKSVVTVHNRYITNTVTATKSVTTTVNFTETEDAVTNTVTETPAAVTNTKTETTTKTESPISMVGPIFAIVAATLYFRKRKN